MSKPILAPSQKYTVEQAYQHCIKISQSHYENFPVASKLMPKRLRPAVAAIYSFARLADDYADEGDLSPEQRLSELESLGKKLEQLENNQPSDEPLFIALQDTIQRFNLPYSLFHDLLTAFKQDVTKTRFANFGEVMSYCRNSANPVGRLLLHLYKQADGKEGEKNLGLSDAICSALQLINFLQDITQDLEENDRIYIPQDEMKQFGVSESDLKHQLTNFRTRSLIQHQVQRAKRLLDSGAPLGVRLKGRIGLELRMIILGGDRILRRLSQQTDNIYSRPRLTRGDWLYIISRAIFPGLFARKSARKSGSSCSSKSSRGGSCS